VLRSLLLWIVDVRHPAPLHLAHSYTTRGIFGHFHPAFKCRDNRVRQHLLGRTPISATS
jgi:hypothetical protein